MQKEVPDNVVFSKEQGYNAHILPYATNVGAPIIKTDDVVSWKNRGIQNVNKEFESKFNELRLQYQKLMEEFEWNELIYNAKFSFEPVVGEIYHLYIAADSTYFLSIISPQEWNKEHIGSFLLNSDKKWIFINQNTKQ
ncbi:DUF2452 domain-containing protein [Flavobacterium alvei]|uniref:DUF2452 domain-containing protein n=1 Tax=Flavobacterium alvei TaxID=2080416 RepID=A0A2S5AG42_9FLAO|nr:DUF2452 domain-containing protein [Flavobacterium alvei]POY41551.1 DUF2452 domain-containing protein [Flavobacterium alvei]HQE33692.1 DUF2452 domain-containing protein [Flavobacterium alvei]HQF48594.1 DUF2452 domain-containing protein [Flavobacterium alvei]HQK39197.1 DUF2452 domain-containing protein [Flavobacterium alvei]